eukprot:9277779-Pyramimonas_sp.AAC.1
MCGTIGVVQTIWSSLCGAQPMAWHDRRGTIDVLQPMWCSPCGAMHAVHSMRCSEFLFAVSCPAHRSRKHPTGLQNPCGGDCDECLVLAGAPLRPR